ncbi:MAG: ATP-binding cassette domain-containing protein [Treponema sp.]|jgi:ABC-type multidrug transport system ATPase subunit|nr:ATP-binding cassette domain-containing protein [Treponema sp.]
MENIVELNNVSFTAQERNIVQEVSIIFKKSKVTALVGPSGGGKSTVLKLSAGLLVPDHGEACYKGKNIAHMNRAENLEFRREGAFVFQDSALWANQDLFQILELPLRIHFPGMSKKERLNRIKEVTAEAGYRKDLGIRPARLSMGEQKLIAFARAMLCNPVLLYLDEWTESLDETAADRLIDLVRKKKKEGATVIFVSHDLRIIKDLADLVVMIADGKTALQATIEQITSDTQLHSLLKMEMAS